MLFFKLSFFYLLMRENKVKDISCKIIELAHNCDFFPLFIRLYLNWNLFPLIFNLLN